MTVLGSKYLTTVRRRLAQVALQRADAPIEKPAVLRSDVRVLLQAVEHAEQEVAKVRAAQVANQAVELPSEQT